MQLEHITEFAGIQDDKVQPSDFLKAVKCAFLAHRATTDEQRIAFLELYLKSDSPAEEWYGDAKTVKKSWAGLEQDFKDRFPNIIKAKNGT